MSDEITNVIMSALTRVESKVDQLNKEVSQINSRLSALEVKMQAQELVNAKVDELSALSNKTVGVKEMIAWAIPTAIALASFFR